MYIGLTMDCTEAYSTDFKLFKNGVSAKAETLAEQYTDTKGSLGFIGSSASESSFVFSNVNFFKGFIW